MHHGGRDHQPGPHRRRLHAIHKLPHRPCMLRMCVYAHVRACVCASMYVCVCVRHPVNVSYTHMQAAAQREPLRDFRLP